MVQTLEKSGNICFICSENMYFPLESIVSSSIIALLVISSAGILVVFDQIVVLKDH